MSVTEKYEHQTLSGLRLKIAAEVQEGRHHVGGVPFAVAVTSDGGIAIGLCDGTSDWGDGRQGSRVAVSTMVSMMIPDADDPGQRLSDAMQLGGMKMCQTNSGEGWPEDFPPSCVAAMLYIRDHSAHVAWIGDGPVFSVRGKEVEEKTRRHLLVEQLIADGHLTREQARDWPHRTVLTRVLGGHEPNEAPPSVPETIGPFELVRGDMILLCYRRVASAFEVAALPGLIVGAAPEAAVAKLLDTAARVDQIVETAAIVVAVS
ncbi:MAG: Protein serine/threonine phosphatase PrpC, regulation of stationary phase [Myxococcales bacterium]|nr:Protein serine/threonine phosphatase PrpC, regulation of stationary phase [Myxococcales bacterium]